MHTHFSDGIDSVDDLLDRADAWFDLISICDHDTIAAYDHVSADRLDGTLRPGRASVLPGIEISCRLVDDREIHLLGYFPHGFTDRFREFAAGIAACRTARVLQGVRRLREKGVALRWSTFEEHYPGYGVPCRSHVARALKQNGTISSHRGVFGRMLGREQFESTPLIAEDAIAMVTAEGGIAVWAHPTPNAAEEHAKRLVAAGLRGLEAYTPSRRPGHIRRIRTVAEELDLIVTGGSDYHGVNTAMPLGRWSFAWEKIPADLLAGVATE